jgi:uncharacterized protein (UPF0332 family)
MSLATDLLEQANHLARRERKRPKQASLRRAISAAYYSLFHLLLKEASQQMVSDANLRCLVSRAFSHGDMASAAKSFASGGSLPAHITAAFPGSIPPEVSQIARAFVDLQQARHDADYNLLKSFTRQEAIDHMVTAQRAFSAFDTIKARPTDKVALELFLSALLLWKQWGKG